jgi:hypothetical protein
LLLWNRFKNRRHPPGFFAALINPGPIRKFQQILIPRFGVAARIQSGTPGANKIFRALRNFLSPFDRQYCIAWYEENILSERCVGNSH